MRGSLVALALLAGLAAPASGPSAAVPRAAPRHERLHYTPQDRETGRYQYVPVAVPAGATRLTVGYSYDAAGGASAIDLGLFEPGPLDLGTRAFRGWSGGARTEVTLTRSEATPGYWPGPLPAGEWHVMLGLYRVAPGGVDVTLTTQVSLEPEAARDATLVPPPAGPLRPGPAWYSGGLHLHTVHSDGGHTTAEVCRRAREAGLDFVVITDHNNTTHQLDAIDEPGLLRIVGEEVTTPGGHAGVWGLGGWRDDVDFRVMPGDTRVADLVRAANARGALFAINHPKASCPGCSWEHAIPDGVTAIEITDAGRTEQLASIALWDALLAQGRRIVGVGSSDWHRPDHPIDWASVRVWARDLSQSAIFEGIRAGRVVVMADGRTPPPVLAVRVGGKEARIGDTLALEKGALATIEVTAPDALADARVDLVCSGAPAASATLERGRPARFERRVEADGYVRAHVTGADGSPVAVTNPVFLKVRGAS